MVVVVCPSYPLGASINPGGVYLSIALQPEKSYSEKGKNGSSRSLLTQAKKNKRLVPFFSAGFWNAFPSSKLKPTHPPKTVVANFSTSIRKDRL
jgi:hypothetical protein